MSGLAGLKVEPVGVLMLVIAMMRPIVDSGWLAVRVPGLDFPTAGLNLWLDAGAVATGQVDGWSGAKARH
jgi:hypothetical protein